MLLCGRTIIDCNVGKWEMEIICMFLRGVGAVGGEANHLFHLFMYGYCRWEMRVCTFFKWTEQKNG